jgi:hypothetical protein
MDDYNISVLIESKNEWCSRLVNLLTPCIFDGIKSIYDESIKICKDEDEIEKYLMTFQNLLTSIPKWSTEIIEKEVQNIINKTNCNYIEDLISCVHIAHLKALTSTRVGIQQKKIDIDIPSLNTFIHKVYINSARKIYSNVYLYEINQIPLQKQKSNREIEYIIKENILTTIRDNIPIEQILRAYIDETEETDVIVEEKKEIIPLENKVVKSNEKINSNKENDTSNISINIDDKDKNESTNKLKNIKDEINEIDLLLNNNLEESTKNNNEESIKETNEININTELLNTELLNTELLNTESENNNNQNNKDENNNDENNNDENNNDENNNDEKINFLNENEDILLNIDTLNSDIEDFDLETIKLE